MRRSELHPTDRTRGLKNMGVRVQAPYQPKEKVLRGAPPWSLLISAPVSNIIATEKKDSAERTPLSINFSVFSTAL